MINFLSKIIRFLFLVKEIVSKEGVVHFRRYRLIQTPWFAIYIHQILKSDDERDMHDHPWNFMSFILQGMYREAFREPPVFNAVKYRTCYPGEIINHKAEDVHKITLMTPEVWTLVFTSKHSGYWGYRLKNGRWMGHKQYRYLKNTNRLP